MKIAWITDSTCSLSEEFIKKHNVFVVPLHIMFGEKSYKENQEISQEELYQKIREYDGPITSSQPAFGDFFDLYQKLKEEYDVGIAIHASSKLTGTYDASKMAAQMNGFKIYAIDSKTGSYPLSYMIKHGVRLVQEGMKINEVVEQIEKMAEQTKLYLIPQNMEQLHKSGRVSGSQMFLATLLKIKPILAVEDGIIFIKQKIRSNKKGKEWILNQLGSDLKNYKIKTVAIVHTDDLKGAESLEKEVKERFPILNTLKMMFIPVVGVHTGVGTIGLSWVFE